MNSRKIQEAQTFVFVELDNELLAGGMGRGGLLAGQIGGGAVGRLGIFVESHGGGVEYDVVVVLVVVVEAILVGVESAGHGLGFCLLHRRSVCGGGGGEGGGGGAGGGGVGVGAAAGQAFGGVRHESEINRAL